MTFLEFKGIVQRFTKVNSTDASVLALIGDAINIAMYDLARENKFTELLKSNVTLTIDNAGTPAQLPIDLLDVERIRYTDGDTLVTWRLFPRRGLIPPAPTYGKPRAYELIQDSVTTNQQDVIYEPFIGISVSDRMALDYYKAPAILVNDGDAPVTLTWDNEIIKRAEHYVLTYMNKPEQAKALWMTKLEQMANPTPPQS